MSMRVAVVGASLAGIRTVQGLRRRGFAGEITLIGDEPGSPTGIAVNRPPLSKDLSGLVPPQPLASPQELDDLDVELVVDTAVHLSVPERYVALRGDRQLSFDIVVLATGSKARTSSSLAMPRGVHVLRTAADSRELQSSCAAAEQIVVVGGGFIGAEVASALRANGKPVVVVEPLGGLMTRILGTSLGEAFARRHIEQGTDVRLGRTVAEIEGTDRVSAVVLDDGTRISAEAVVIGLGTVPETAWLEDSALSIDDGILCDHNLRALGTDCVYAVGDVARWRHPRYDEDVRYEHWTNAVESAQAVAATISGAPTVYDNIPYVWSEQLGSRIQVFGRVRQADAMQVVHGDLDGEFVVTTEADDGVMQAVISFGAIKQTLPYRARLAAGGS